MRCTHCGCVFCVDYDDASNPIFDPTPRRYCGHTCAKAAKRGRARTREAAEAAVQAARRACARKRSFPSERDALWAIGNWATSQTGKHPPAGAYECPDCHQWHTTSWQDQHGTGRFVAVPGGEMPIVVPAPEDA